MSKKNKKLHNNAEKDETEQMSEAEAALNGAEGTGEVPDDATTEGEAAERQPTEEQAIEPTAEERLAAAEARNGQLTDQLLRQAAEFDNYRKRTIKEKSELIRNASADIVAKILPVLDDMERAIAHNEKSDDTAVIKDGFKLIYNKLMHTLEAEGLKKIQAKGEAFDTDRHEAIATIPATPENEKGTVIDCTRDGYTLNDKVIRIAQVVVAN